MLYWKREISATPIQLHLKELYGEFYPHNLASNPEMKAVLRTFARKFSNIDFFSENSTIER